MCSDYVAALNNVHTFTFDAYFTSNTSALNAGLVTDNYKSVLLLLMLKQRIYVDSLLWTIQILQQVSQTYPREWLVRKGFLYVQ